MIQYTNKYKAKKNRDEKTRIDHMRYAHAHVNIKFLLLTIRLNYPPNNNNNQYIFLKIKKSFYSN